MRANVESSGIMVVNLEPRTKKRERTSELYTQHIYSGIPILFYISEQSAVIHIADICLKNKYMSRIRIVGMTT